LSLDEDRGQTQHGISTVTYFGKLGAESDGSLKGRTAESVTFVIVSPGWAIAAS
jgi:hypothetical protein